MKDEEHMGFNVDGKIFEAGRCPKCHTGKFVPYPEWRESVCYVCGNNRYWDAEPLPRLYFPGIMLEPRAVKTC